MNIQYTTEGVLMLPGGPNADTAKVRWIRGEALIKIHQGNHTIELTAAQFQTMVANADAILATSAAKSFTLPTLEG